MSKVKILQKYQLEIQRIPLCVHLCGEIVGASKNPAPYLRLSVLFAQ